MIFLFRWIRKKIMWNNSLCEQVCLVCHILYTTFICFKPLQKSLLFSQKRSILDVFDRVLSTLLTFLFYVRNVYFRCPGAAARSCSVRKVFLENSQNSHKIPYARVPFFNKVAGWGRGVSCVFEQVFLHTCFLWILRYF